MNDWSENALPRRDFLKISAVAAGSSLAFSGWAHAAGTKLPQGHRPLRGHKGTAGGMALLEQEVVDTLTPKDYSHLVGQVEGFSENQLRQHFKLYENYVNRTNTIHQLIAQADDEMLNSANPSYSPFRELHVEQSFVHNGVVLHELYFGNLGPKSNPTNELKAMVNRYFGSWENYTKHLVAVGKAMRGWAITGFDLRDGKLRNFGLDQHHQWVPTHFYPILVLDVYEHAYMIDYGTDRGKYLTAFMNNVNWEAVNKRLLFAVHHLMAGPSSTV